MKLCPITLAVVLLYLLPVGMPTLAQTASNSPSSSAPKASANRFSDTGSTAGTVTPPANARTTATKSRNGADANQAQWYALALAAFLSLRYFLWILGIAASFCAISAILAHLMYRNHQPQSAYGAAHWSVFWALLICSLSPFLIGAFFVSWSWLAWILVSFPFTVLAFIMLMILLTNRPVRVS